MHPYLRSLCEDYVRLVELMRSGQYTEDELPTIDSQRTVTHNQLLELTGMTRRDDMYAHARAVLAAQGEPNDGRETLAHRSTAGLSDTHA